jgi:hypothetical protein
MIAAIAAGKKKKQMPQIKLAVALPLLSRAPVQTGWAAPMGVTTTCTPQYGHTGT